MYREYRDLTVAGGVTQCCKPHLKIFLLPYQFFCPLDRDMAARHRARASSIHIIKVECIAADKCRRPHVKQFHVSLIDHVTICHVTL